MKASELIERLTKLVESEGDKEVCDCEYEEIKTVFVLETDEPRIIIQ